MDAEDILRGASHLTNSAENYVNDASVEELWVRKACRYADVHQKLISTFDPTLLKLTKHDDRIYEAFKTQFPDFNIENVEIESLKYESNKEKWRSFCDEFKDVESFNFGTLVRMNCREKYTQANTILVTRIQFLALEIARNREGMNNYMWTTASAAEGLSTNEETAPTDQAHAIATQGTTSIDEAEPIATDELSTDPETGRTDQPSAFDNAENVSTEGSATTEGSVPIP